MCVVCHKPATTGQTPAVTTGSASSITSNSALLSGTLDNMGGASSVSVSIQWGTASGSYTQVTTSQNLAATGAFQSAATGLTTGTTYFYRAQAVVGSSTVYGAEKTFATSGTSGGGGAPSVTTGSASGVTANAATLSGNLASLGSAASATVSFQWGTASGSYVNATTGSVMNTAASFQATVTGLAPVTTYYFRAMATGAITSYGAEGSFTTGQAGTPPSVTTTGAINVTATSATLQGTFNSLGSAPSVDISFQWGTASGSYINHTAPTTMGTTAAFQANLTGLLSGTRYYFRAMAVGNGTSYGAEMSFTAGQSGSSSGTPTVSTSNAINVTANSATLRGSVDGLGGLTSIDANFQWGTVPGSYTGQTTVTTMGTTGIFQFNLTGLTSGTTYYFRAKGTNGTTTVYGTELSFTAP